MLSESEQETVINIDRESDTAEIYTTIPETMKELDKAPSLYRLKAVARDGRRIVSKTYVCEKRFIVFRKKDTRKKPRAKGGQHGLHSTDERIPLS